MALEFIAPSKAQAIKHATDFIDEKVAGRPKKVTSILETEINCRCGYPTKCVTVMSKVGYEWINKTVIYCPACRPHKN